MTAWIKNSPFRAAGIYISGNSRACRTQANLTPTWVRNQLGAGLAPDADHARAAGVLLDALPALRQEHRPDDHPEHGQRLRLRAGPGPGRGEEGGQHRAATRHRRGQHPLLRPRGLRHAHRHGLHLLGAVVHHAPGPASCTRSGTPPASTPARPPASGCSTTPGSRRATRHASPTRSGSPTGTARPTPARRTSAATGGSPYSRMKQYQGGHNETWGGVTINIDRNYLDLRRREAPGGSGTPRSDTGADGAEVHRQLDHRRPLHADVDHQARATASPREPEQGADRAAAVPAQAAAPLQVRGHRALEQPDPGGAERLPARLGHAKQSYVSRGTWAALLTAGQQPHPARRAGPRPPTRPACSGP